MTEIGIGLKEADPVMEQPDCDSHETYRQDEVEKDDYGKPCDHGAPPVAVYPVEAGVFLLCVSRSPSKVALRLPEDGQVICLAIFENGPLDHVVPFLRIIICILEHDPGLCVVGAVTDYGGFEGLVIVQDG